MELRELVEVEARAAQRSGPQLSDDAVAEALRAAAAFARGRRVALLDANRADCEAAAGRLDEGTLDRLRLDDARAHALARQLEATAELPPQARDRAPCLASSSRGDAEAIRAVGAEHDEYRLISYSLAGLMLLSDDSGTAEHLLDEAFSGGGDPAEDKFAAKYLRTSLEIDLAPGISAALPVDRDAVGLSLAEMKQERGDLDGAIDVVEQLEPSTYAAVSLADLYAAAERYDDVIELTEGLRNEDDASALLLAYRGMAFRHKGFYDAAHEALKEALKARSRAASIRHLALIERADNYLAQNKKAMARKDLERILAEDSTVEGVADRLAGLA